MVSCGGFGAFRGLAASTTATFCEYWWVTVYCCSAPQRPETLYSCMTVVQTAAARALMSRSRFVCFVVSEWSVREAAHVEDTMADASSSVGVDIDVGGRVASASMVALGSASASDVSEQLLIF